MNQFGCSSVFPYTNKAIPLPWSTSTLSSGSAIFPAGDTSVCTVLVSSGVIGVPDPFGIPDVSTTVAGVSSGLPFPGMILTGWPGTTVVLEAANYSLIVVDCSLVIFNRLRVFSFFEILYFHIFIEWQKCVYFETCRLSKTFQTLPSSPPKGPVFWAGIWFPPPWNGLAQ